MGQTWTLPNCKLGDLTPGPRPPENRAAGPAPYSATFPRCAMLTLRFSRCARWLGRLALCAALLSRISASSAADGDLDKEFHSAQRSIQNQMKSKNREQRLAAVRKVEAYPVVEAAKLLLLTGLASG